LSTLKPEALHDLYELAELAGHDLGINATTNFDHDDPRHNGVSAYHPARSNPALSGLAVDVGEIDHVTVRQASASSRSDLKNAALGMDDVKDVLTPSGLFQSAGFGQPKTEFQNSGLLHEHAGHFHISFFADWEQR